MSNRIKIVEAVSLCNASTSKPVKDIERDLMDYLWPESSHVVKRQNLYYLKGYNSRFSKLSFDQVRIICQVTGCDANFLFEIN